MWRWDNLLYDTQLSYWSRPAADDIIIINIDDESLSELGRWPWPRSLHAKLIQQINKESPLAIGLDIIFSEPDTSNPQSDALLAQAIGNSGKVVLPVLMTQKSSNAYPIEALPLPELTTNTAALGHVHIDISNDGIARQVYLREGIGKPQWDYFALALLEVAGHSHNLELEEALKPANDGQAAIQTEQYSTLHWSREHPYLIPYAGPTGHYTHIGFSQVLAGNYAKNLFHNKIVLIGATAEGLGDALPIPLSGQGGVMPGVEIVANILDAIRQGYHIETAGVNARLLLTITLVLLPLLLYPYLTPAGGLATLIISISSTVLLMALLLVAFGYWLPVSSILLFQLIGYPLWSWRRLAFAMRHINNELDVLTEKQKTLSIQHGRNLSDEIDFSSQLLPIKGWVILTEGGTELLKNGSPPTRCPDTFQASGWHIDDCNYWCKTCYKGRVCLFGLNMNVDTELSKEEHALLDSLVIPISPANNSHSCSPNESANQSPDQSHNNKHTLINDVLQNKIRQVKKSGDEFEKLRLIIDDALSGMADGVLICNSGGQIILSNHRACWYLYGDDDADINGRSINDVLQKLHLHEGTTWQTLLRRVLFNQERVLSQCQHNSGRDLMVEISSLRMVGDTFNGFVVNFSDISLLKEAERNRNEALNFLSHDLRSPLASLIAMIELAKNHVDINEVKDLLLSMENNTHKTLHLAEQFLQLSRANSNVSLRFYDVDFNNVVLNAIDQLWASSNRQQIKIRHKFSQEELWIHAEPDLLERAVVNLLSNAIKYSAGNDVSVTVSVEKDTVRCCVQDQGAGIPAEELPYLFEIYRQAQGKSIERKQGFGLGLAFVDAVAKRHSGQTEVESWPGKGSRFCIAFPKIDAVE